MKRSRLETGLDPSVDLSRVAALVRDAKIPPGVEIWRFEMFEALTQGWHPSSIQYANAMAVRWDDYQNRYSDEPALKIRVYDFQCRFSKPATVDGDVGAQGLAIRYPDRPEEFGILTMEPPGPFRAPLYDDMTQYNETAYVSISGTLPIMLGGYRVFGPAYRAANSNKTLVYNMPGTVVGLAPYWWAGFEYNYVLCVWDGTLSRYTIWGVQPNSKGYLTLDVMTDISINFVGETYTYATREIKLPPWASIGDTVWH